MSLHLQITDPEGLMVVIRIPGSYNPDTLDDGKSRLLDTYRESLAFRHAMASVVFEEATDDDDEASDGGE